MIDLVREVDLVAVLHQLHGRLRAVVRRQVEVTGHFVQHDVTFDLASFLLIKLPFGCAVDHVLVSISCLLLQLNRMNDASVM